MEESIGEDPFFGEEGYGGGDDCGDGTGSRSGYGVPYRQAGTGEDYWNKIAPLGHSYESGNYRTEDYPSAFFNRGFVTEEGEGGEFYLDYHIRNMNKLRYGES